jgi:hypothetical protein
MTTVAVAPSVGAKVRHPLWPELGVGEVQTSGTAVQVQLRSGWIRWSCGQVSRHNLSVLREVR